MDVETALGAGQVHTQCEMIRNDLRLAKSLTRSPRGKAWAEFGSDKVSGDVTQPSLDLPLRGWDDFDGGEGKMGFSRSETA